MFKEEREESRFEWSMLGDIEKGRPNLGPMVHVIRDYGVEEADKIFFEAGKKAGEEYCENILTEKKDLNGLSADLQRTMKEFGIGIYRVEPADWERGSFVVTVAEDLDCSGIPICSEEICIYDEGFIAGLLLAYTGKDFTVKEVDCWGTGDRVCRFTVDPK
jgi:predicted hydrocarbon binding protein